jgi:SigmaK-factor processing regulatory protein BofA
MINGIDLYKNYDYLITMALLGIGILILVIIIFLAVAFFVIKNVIHLVINAIIGLITLFIVNYFHLMQFAGKPDIGFDWITIIICALAGFPGAVLLVILSLLGITL